MTTRLKPEAVHPPSLTLPHLGEGTASRVAVTSVLLALTLARQHLRAGLGHQKMLAVARKVRAEVVHMPVAVPLEPELVVALKASLLEVRLKP
jgi:hypothetical protein